MRKKIIAGNWKMNAVKEEAIALLNGIVEQYNTYNLSPNKSVIIATPFPYIDYCATQFSNFQFLHAAAQNCSEYEQGAYTGEVSAKIIASLGVQYVIIGHSERRQYFNENDFVLLAKIKQAQLQNMIPIFCCGEPIEVRENEEHFSFIKQQLSHCIFHLTPQEIKNCIIAYEPIWAIGTGKTATQAQAQEMHAFIRKEIENKFDKPIADSISILYGGSVNAVNAAELFASNDIDGALVGGASLKINDFSTIINAMPS
ncbi:MAG TPA: triose-phosphate isomerase [Chitinophagales bacterium]|nr:triose-phosphate isomerase [Chitinophagales bacterium]HMW11814.1 triose-phosphate isomerase [Chitinophagales bacterium]HMX59057.1 triose-phosphate isomerase [Chitinophagales bacterium]HMY24301.1 triose-phosphate isomerase [Chitinophagales bacterium]HMZ33910.1 triose-phosphate isomerase [Chitinophagales bacterium]